MLKTTPQKTDMTTSAMLASEEVGDEQFYIRLHNFMYSIILPIILALGFFGNFMNLFILTGKRIQHSLRNSEKSANAGIIALTISDLAFCITAFPTTFLPADSQFSGEPGFYAYYGLYSAAVISVFIMASTWLTVALAVERYRAICRPLSSRTVVSNLRTICIIIFIFSFSFLFNLPMFLKLEFETKYLNVSHLELDTEKCNFYFNDVMETKRINKINQFLSKTIEEKHASPTLEYHKTPFNNTTDQFLFDNFNYNLNKNDSHKGCDNYTLEKITIVRSTTSTDDVSEHVFRLMWGIVGNVIPLLTLAFCNTTLLIAIQKSYALRKQMNRSLSKSLTSSNDQDSSQRITITLVCIVAMFLVLVAPSEIVKYFSILLSVNLDTNFHFKSIEVITNVMQSLNFSVNFILYCIVNPSFRKTMYEMIPFNHRLGKASTINIPSRPISISSIKGSNTYHRNQPLYQSHRNNKQLRNNSNNSRNKPILLDCRETNNFVASSLLNKVKSSSCKHVVINLSNNRK